MQSLAVTTVMPVVSADLDGAALYAVAFAGTLATSVIGMVAVGAWCDRGGVARAAHGRGGAVRGRARAWPGSRRSMEVLVAGRLIQGLGTGGQTVALYVVVARVYPPAIHGRVFAAFSAAWVVPSLIGPFLAGAVAEYLHWRWVFLGVAVLTVVAFIMVVLRPARPAARTPTIRRRTAIAAAPRLRGRRRGRARSRSASPADSGTWSWAGGRGIRRRHRPRVAGRCCRRARCSPGADCRASC